ncbi:MULTISPECIES: dihydroorotase [Mammaliicoccus]|uniref:Amidohydrolase family protein n=1 Tax=Mammaliicoccus lentus TaxID=42858 RepID=A0ABS6GVP0_MAMLE|nr:amidohydrolase family protein [Mammaliicoccus lentus]MBU6113489.1 amidohydrolase family protein [Mammaliicoccus lentus]
MRYDVVVRGTYVSNGLQKGDIGIQDGKIVELSGYRTLSADKVIEYNDEIIFPGFIDSHVHCYSNPNEGMNRATRAAAQGGITTIIDMPYDRPEPIDTVEKFNRKIEDINQNAVVDVALWGTVAKNKGVNQVQKMIDAGAIAFKLSTFETDPQRFPSIPDHQIIDIMKITSKNDILLAFHAENEDIITNLVNQYTSEGKVEAIYHHLSRPPESESSAVSSLLDLAYWNNAKLHLVHISHPHTVDMIEKMKKIYSINVTYETCYQYLTLDTDSLKKYGVIAKCNPALRRPSEVEQLNEQLQKGDIDFITSDHAPWVKDKTEKNIFKAPSGLTGLDIMIPVMFDYLVSKKGFNEQKFSELFSSNIAERFNLVDKGKIEEGYDADFTVINPNKPWKLEKAFYQSISNQSVFNGNTIGAQIIETIVRGKTVYHDKEVTFENKGKFIPGLKGGRLSEY